MIQVTSASSQPVAPNEHLDGNGAQARTPKGPPELWTEVHEEVQRLLAPLENEVARKAPGVRVAAGRTQGTKFFLFSYRVFSLPDSSLDAVVVGITFMPADQSVRVEGDVSGEEGGDVLLNLPSETVPASREELLAAAGRAARQLGQAAELIAVALGNPSRRVE